MANTIEKAKLFQKNLDKAMIQQAVTGWMEANAGQVIYSGGSEVKIPKLSMDGLGNYDRNIGYLGGDVNFQYETKTMSYDRGRKFSIDALDVDETGFVLTASTIMGEFQREKVVPEIDAIRLSKLAQVAITADNVKYSFVATKTNVIDEFKDSIVKIRNNGFTGRIICHCSYDFKAQIEKAMAGQLSPATLSLGGVDTQIPSFDGVLLIPTTSDKLFTKYILNDGKTSGQTAGGFVKDASALTINFILVAEETPIAISKTDTIRIFDPSINQSANAWSLDYRKFHDIWVMDNKVNGIYLNVKEAKPTA